MRPPAGAAALAAAAAGAVGAAAAGGFYICTQPLSNGSLPLIACQTMHLNQPLNVC